MQFIALDQAKAKSRTCIANDDTLVSCALEHNQLTGWTTIVSDCEPEQIELAYSKDWKLVVAPNTTNPLVDGYNTDDPAKYRNVCWAEKTPGDRGRPYNIAYFENVASKETVLFVIVHMPHQYPEIAPARNAMPESMTGISRNSRPTSKPSSAPTSISQKCISSPPET